MSDEVSPAWLARLRTTVSADPWIHGFAVVERQSQLVIGSVGFKGPPDAVLDAIYAAFAEGWTDPAGTEVRRRNLGEEGIWLGRCILNITASPPFHPMWRTNPCPMRRRCTAH